MSPSGAMNRIEVIAALESMASEAKSFGDRLVREIKLGTADEWTAYELIRAAERELEAASVWLLRDLDKKAVGETS